MDIINVLPDSVANQIAAGEVIQRPMSVVKELVENSIDAGATNITINILEAGKSEIQIIDNGYGMSENDAAICFERHATSKIKEAQDLFALRTMGFRGEALAAIASIAIVELKTKRNEDEMGNIVVIEGAEIVKREPFSCSNGTTITVKNLFFNVPARRNFLKSNNAEFTHIQNTLYRIVLVYPAIRFKLIHNGKTIFDLPISNLKQRINNVYGNNYSSKLFSIKTETAIVNIEGFISKPENAKKQNTEQYFFVNKRYMRHPYFHKAVINSFERLLPSEYSPSYFVYLDLEPDTIDVNVHPTKTEIKFRNEQHIFQILQASIKESLGKFNISDSLDFEVGNSIKIPIYNPNKEVYKPTVDVDDSYNPFKTNSFQSAKASSAKVFNDWQKLYEGFDKSQKIEVENLTKPLFEQPEEKVVSSDFEKIMQIKDKYLITPLKWGLAIIDIKKAQEKIFFSKIINNLKNPDIQVLLYPKTILLDKVSYQKVQSILKLLNNSGFLVEDFGGNSIIINGIPSIINEVEAESIVLDFIDGFDEDNKEIVNFNFVAERLAKSFSYKHASTLLNDNEMNVLVGQLFQLPNPSYTNDGRIVIKMVSFEELTKGF